MLSTYNKSIVKTKPNYHHGDLRYAIIDRALSWIEAKDISSLSLRGIARELEVSHNAPYRHFADKETLLVEIARIGFTELGQWLQQIEDIDCQPKEKIKALGVKYIQYAVSHAAYYRVMYDTSYDRAKHPELEAVFRETFNILTEAIAEGQARETIKPEDTKQLAYVCWSLVHGVSMLSLDRQLTISDIGSLDNLARLATEMTIEGLKNNAT